MAIELAPSEQNMWTREPRSQSPKPGDEEINAKYGRRELRIVTESNREQLPNFVEALKRPGWMKLRPPYQMAVKQVKDGFFSTLTQHSYESEKAAQFYDDRARMEARTATEGEKVLASLSTEQLKSVLIAANAQIDEQNNKGFADEKAAEWLQQHPELFSQSAQQSTINGASLRTYLLQQGKHEPFSKYDLDLAYSALQDLGALHIDESKKPKAEVKTADSENTYGQLDAWQANAYRFRSGW